MTENVAVQLRALVMRASESESLHQKQNPSDATRGTVFILGESVDVSDKKLDLLARKAISAVNDVLTLLRTREALSAMQRTRSAADEAERQLQAIVDAAKADY